MQPNEARDVRETEECAHHLQVTRASLLRYRAAMTAVVRSVGVTGPLVDDVVQNAFEAACRKPAIDRPSTRDEIHFGKWLCALARYAALSARNEHTRSREVVSPTEMLEDVPASHRAYIGHYDDKVAVSVVFASLSEDDGALLHQHFYEDKTVQELAAERGVPWSTMRSRIEGVLERARIIMQECKPGGRRGVGAAALILLGLGIRTLQERVHRVRSQIANIAWGRAFDATLGGLVVGTVVLALLVKPVPTNGVENKAAATAIANATHDRGTSAGSVVRPASNLRSAALPPAPPTKIVPSNSARRVRSSSAWNIANGLRDH